MIQSLPEHNVGEQQMNHQMAANAIWNKLNYALGLLDFPSEKKELERIICEARALADSIVHSDCEKGER